ncbi:M42 family metallopeptidase [Treponema putidum]|uniref:M42 family peptidase n=1 Tax=Treponema putidum TaxID=221027 RepID=A0AAE9SJZ3_9SPIR|nr:M42 family metallopeptidase [Treponema putidum]TWI77120.1 putative aminopeptidase FrvX [Treponema putidum]UTY28901.1 M42 family peptidase [Treponema putidum]UTY33752.1 M42 family peptidase [Treponema putidum]
MEKNKINELKTSISNAAEKVMDEIITICNIPSPTGYTCEAADYVMKRLSGLGFKPWLTNKGAVVCELDKNAEPNSGKKGDKALLLSAHIDTLGLFVRHIKSSGRLRTSLDGGFPYNYVEQSNVTVITREGKKYEGTMRLTEPAVHASREINELKRDDSNMELVLDEIVKSREDVEKLGIMAGDVVAIESLARKAGNGFLKSRHLDDKASCGMFIYLAEQVAKGELKLKRKTYIMFTNYEEIGHGASAGHPEGISDMLAVDMGVVGSDLDTDEYAVSICAKDSSGPYNYEFTSELIKIAKEMELNFAVDVYPFYGSDASAALSAGYDYRHALIGTGVAASHGYERIHKQGLENTLLLLTGYISDCR